MSLHPLFVEEAKKDAPPDAREPGLKPEGRFSNLYRVCKVLKLMVGERGFEPPTPWSRTRCSTRLSPPPTYCLIYSFSILQGHSGRRKRACAGPISVARYRVRLHRCRCNRY